MDALLASLVPKNVPHGEEGQTWRGAQNLPADTERILTALAHLPPLVDVDETPLTPGPGAGTHPCGEIRSSSTTGRRGLERDSSTSTRT
jgi:hypothetical protein